MVCLPPHCFEPGGTDCCLSPSLWDYETYICKMFSTFSSPKIKKLCILTNVFLTIYNFCYTRKNVVKKWLIFTETTLIFASVIRNCLVYHVSNVFQRSPRRGDISDGDYFKPWKLPYFFFIKHQKYRSYYNTYRYVWLDTHLIQVRNMINWTISVVWWENQNSFC